MALVGSAGGFNTVSTMEYPKNRMKNRYNITIEGFRSIFLNLFFKVLVIKKIILFTITPICVLNYSAVQYLFTFGYGKEQGLQTALAVQIFSSSALHDPTIFHNMCCVPSLFHAVNHMCAYNNGIPFGFQFCNN